MLSSWNDGPALGDFPWSRPGARRTAGASPAFGTAVRIVPASGRDGRVLRLLRPHRPLREVRHHRGADDLGQQQGPVDGVHRDERRYVVEREEEAFADENRQCRELRQAKRLQHPRADADHGHRYRHEGVDHRHLRELVVEPRHVLRVGERIRQGASEEQDDERQDG